MIRVVLVVFALLVVPSAAAACRLGLALALDVSGSVDATEYRQQLDGIAAALKDKEVTAALLAVPGRPVSLVVYEWSGTGFQRELLAPLALIDRGAIATAANRLRGARRVRAPQKTGLGGALLAGVAALDRGPVCDRRVIDVSGDGENNDWPPPERVRESGRLGETVVNALVILPGPPQTDPEGLVGYFRARVLHGAGAFLEEASGYADYERAMRRKLLREVSAPRIGETHDADRRKADPSKS